MSLMCPGTFARSSCVKIGSGFMGVGLILGTTKESTSWTVSCAVARKQQQQQQQQQQQKHKQQQYGNECEQSKRWCGSVGDVFDGGAWQLLVLQVTLLRLPLLLLLQADTYWSALLTAHIHSFEPEGGGVADQVAAAVRPASGHSTA
jgi:membrane protease subunit (stomatin/prohibitin family)